MRMIYLIYNFCVTILTILVIASYLGKWFWICDLLSNFRLYYILVSLAFLIFAIILKNRTGKFLLLSLLAIQSVSVFQSYLSHSYVSDKNAVYEEISLLQFNVYFQNKNYTKIVNYILKNQEKLDIIFLQEVVPDLETELQRLDKYFPYKVTVSDKLFGRALYSKIPILSHEIKFFDNRAPDQNIYSSRSKNSFFGTNMHYLMVQLETKKHSIPLTLYGIHTTAPLSKNLWRIRNNELTSLAQVANQDKLNKYKIIIGDFNLSSSSYWYRLLEKSSNLISAERGTGINNTWPSWLNYNLLRISIDNALVSKNIIVLDRTIGENLESDHLPVILKLKLLKDQY